MAIIGSHGHNIWPYWALSSIGLHRTRAKSRVYDRLFKRDAYFALGVAQVWLVDIADRSVEVWRSRTVHDVVRDVIRWRVPTTDAVVTIDLAEVFAGLA